MLTERYRWTFWAMSRKGRCRERQGPFLPCLREKEMLQSCKVLETARVRASVTGGWPRMWRRDRELINEGMPFQAGDSVHSNCAPKGKL